MEDGQIYFEDVHQATPQRPYVSWNSRDLNYVMHYHQELEIAYVAEGAVEVTTEKDRFLLYQGEICLFMPMEIHNITTPLQSCCWIIKAFPFSGKGWELSHLRLKKPVFSPEDTLYSLLLTHLYRIRRESKDNGEIGELAIALTIGEIQLCILRNMPHAELDPKEQNKISRNVRLLAQVNDYLQMHYTEPVTLDGIAICCHMSKYHFAHCFREAARTSFGEYLARFRLDKVMGMMQNTELPLTMIALNCGFGSVRTFNRVFFQYYHTSPSAFRKGCRRNQS